MKKTFVLIAILLTYQICLIAQPASSQASIRDRITKIDADSELLHAELNNERIEAENAEMQSQPMMYDDWSNYSSLMEEMEKRERRIEKIKEQIHNLELEKQALLKKG